MLWATVNRAKSSNSILSGLLVKMPKLKKSIPGAPLDVLVF